MTTPVMLFYFAGVRDLVGRGEERIELPEDVRTIADLARFLEGHRPSLAGRLHAVRFAVNEAFVEPREVLRRGDVVALIPPVSGG